MQEPVSRRSFIRDLTLLGGTLPLALIVAGALPYALEVRKGMDELPPGVTENSSAARKIGLTLPPEILAQAARGVA
jgi:hypothetical protein